jgi:hypothetical protein
MDYVELHCHSYYSLLDGTSAPADLVSRAADLGMEALALTCRRAGCRRNGSAAPRSPYRPLIVHTLKSPGIGAHVVVDQHEQAAVGGQGEVLAPDSSPPPAFIDPPALQDGHYVELHNLSSPCSNPLLAQLSCPRGALFFRQRKLPHTPQKKATMRGKGLRHPPLPPRPLPYPLLSSLGPTEAEPQLPAFLLLYAAVLSPIVAGSGLQVSVYR